MKNGSVIVKNVRVYFIQNSKLLIWSFKSTNWKKFEKQKLNVT